MIPGRRADERGFALVAVLLVLTLLGIVGAEFAFSMRLEASAVRAWKDGLIAAHLAEAAFAQAMREIAADVFYVAVADDGDLTFYTRDRLALPRLPRHQVPLGTGQFSYRITDEEARLNLNTSPPDRVDRLLTSVGLTKAERDVIIDSIQDWLDANEEHRANGAESDDYYLKLPVPHRSRNGPLESVAELLQIRGMTPRILNGDGGTAGLGDLITVKTPGQININTASGSVLQALGLSDAEILDISQARRDGPYPTVPGRFTGRGLVTATRTFRIEAQGLVEGEVRARLTAIVQKRADGGGAIAVLEWSGDH